MALLEVDNLQKAFPVHGGIFKRVVARVNAVNGVSFKIQKGETVGVVGESGCGKTTLGKNIIRLQQPTAGRILFKGHDLAKLSRRELRPLRKNLQFIFQDPYSSLNPRQTIRAILKEPVLFHKIVPRAETDAYVEDLVLKVGLRPEILGKFPHEFSGGQRQRISIGRALAVRPELIIADEPVSALDVSIQAQVLNLMLDLQEEFDLTYLMIAHDLKLVEHFCDRALVMYLGFVVEDLPCDDLVGSARHPYSQALLASTPIDHPNQRKQRAVLAGELPSPMNLPKGCAFAGRCPKVEDRCHRERPPLQSIGPEHAVACHLVQPSAPTNVTE